MRGKVAFRALERQPLTQYTATCLRRRNDWSRFKRYFASTQTHFTSSNPTIATGPHQVLTSLFTKTLHKAYPVLKEGNVKALIALAHADLNPADYQCNSPLALAKKLKEEPLQIAKKILDTLSEHTDVIRQCTLREGGFIDIFLQDQWISQQIPHVHNLSSLRHLPCSSPKKILIDYSSPNMAKEMHVGHLRSIVIGDALANILSYCGHTVDRVSHVGDFGTPLAMAVAIGLEKGQQHKKDGTLPSPTELSSWYVEGKTRFDGDAAFSRLALNLTLEIQKGRERCKREVWEMYEMICDASRRGFDQIYQRMGVNVEERGESYYRDMLPGVVQELLQKGIAEESDGAVCIFSRRGKRQATGKTQAKLEAPLMIRKKDGGYLYGTTDLAAVKQRIEMLRCDWIIYVTDNAQRPHFSLVFEAAQRAGWYDPLQVRIDHASFGVVQGKDGKKLRSRDGADIRLLEFLDQAVESARQTAEDAQERKDSSQEHLYMSAEEKERFIANLAYGSIKYFDLCQHRAHDYVFSFERMLSFKGNTAVYMMYAYTRIRSLLRKAEERKAKRKGAEVVLEEKAERDLAISISRFMDVIGGVEEKLLPHLVCEYLYDVATKFHLFYEKCRVLESERMESRLYLCEVTQGVLQKGLSLLGVQSSERM